MTDHVLDLIDHTLESHGDAMRWSPKPSPVVMTGFVPIHDRDYSPPDAELLEMAVELFAELAATRGMHAVNVRIVERLPGLWDDEGELVLGEYGAPLAPKGVLCKAEAIAI